jgi:hypothetical protein
MEHGSYSYSRKNEATIGYAPVFMEVNTGKVIDQMHNKTRHATASSRSVSMILPDYNTNPYYTSAPAPSGGCALRSIKK